MRASGGVGATARLMRQNSGCTAGAAQQCGHDTHVERHFVLDARVVGVSVEHDERKGQDVGRVWAAHGQVGGCTM